MANGIFAVKATPSSKTVVNKKQIAAKSCDKGANIKEAAIIKKDTNIIIGMSGRKSTLAKGETIENLPKLSRIIGVVNTVAARVTDKLSAIKGGNLLKYSSIKGNKTKRPAVDKKDN